MEKNTKHVVAAIVLALSLTTQVTADSLHPLTEHCRIVDTRNIPLGPVYLQPGVTYTFFATLASSTVQGGDGFACGVPSDATSIFVNITETSANGWGT